MSLGGKVTKFLKIAEIILLVIIGIVIVVVSVLTIYYFAVVKTAPTGDKTSNDVFTNSQKETVDRVVVGDKGKKYYTFLAAATDKAGNLTDVIMVARLTYKDEHPKVSILQIPRDTYVKISAWKLHFDKDGLLSKENFTTATAATPVKINEVYFRGKNLGSNYIVSLLKDAGGKTDAEIEELCKSQEYKFLDVDIDKVKNYVKSNDKNARKEIENNLKRDFGLFYLENLIFHYFRIPIDYSAQVNIAGFRGIVDAIGGVDLYVPQDMYYNDPTQGLYINLKKGQQHLDGVKSEQFVRFRTYARGDIDRLEAQKIFMNAFIDKLLSLSTLGSIDDIVKELQSNLYTNVSFDNMLRFANKIVKMDLANDITMITLPGWGEYIGEISYYIINRTEAIKVINTNFNVYDKELLAEDFKMINSSEIERPKIVAPAESEKMVEIEIPVEVEKNTDTEPSVEQVEPEKSVDSVESSESVSVEEVPVEGGTVAETDAEVEAESEEMEKVEMDISEDVPPEPVVQKTAETDSASTEENVQDVLRDGADDDEDVNENGDTGGDTNASVAGVTEQTAFQEG